MAPQAMGDWLKPPPIQAMPELVKTPTRVPTPTPTKPLAPVMAQPVVPEPAKSMPAFFTIEKATTPVPLVIKSPVNQVHRIGSPRQPMPPVGQPAPPAMPIPPPMQMAQELTKTEMKPLQVQTQTEPEWWTARNAMTISSVVLLWGAIILSTAAYLIKSGRASDSVLRLFGTILIIVGAIFLVVAGYSDKQIAPVMGLLGTIVGYLLGKDTKEVPRT